jgi:glycerol-3-phosphate dehydrogenase (NAD(P)+)
MTARKVCIVGAGAWGTALALQAHRAGSEVLLWARDPARADSLSRTRENARLPGFSLPPPIRVTADPHAIAGDLLVLAVPVQHLAASPCGTGPIVIAAKGLEQNTLRLPLEIFADPAAVLTGPNFAHEIAAGLPAAAVVAADDPSLRQLVIQSLGSRTFRLYGSADPIGAQLGGAAKNVVAIAAGAVIGAGLGENARAALVTRGLAEIGRLAVALGGRMETIAGLSGLGDLLLTCTGPASRNYSLGLALGRGESLAAILAQRSTITEGVTTAPALVARAARAGLEMPLCAAVAALLAGEKSLSQAMHDLLARPRRDE